LYPSFVSLSSKAMQCSGVRSAAGPVIVRVLCRHAS
jgi:hypothetical protein